MLGSGMSLGEACSAGQQLLHKSCGNLRLQQNVLQVVYPPRYSAEPSLSGIYGNTQCTLMYFNNILPNQMYFFAS